MESGIAVRVTFRFRKGYWNPHAEKAAKGAWRTFTMLPTKGERYEFDLSLILFGIAVNRGLFVENLEEIMKNPTNERTIHMVPEVARQAVRIQHKRTF
jgi:hypothetical protein